MTSVPHVDAVVLGGGPAGAAAALSLRRRGHTAALVEASGYESERIGETLVPPVRGVLEHLGAWDAFLAAGEHLPAHATRAAWGGDEPGANPFVLYARGCGWQVDRRAFDELLAGAAGAAGVAVHLRSRLRAAQRTAAGWRLTIHDEDGGHQFELDAAIVVDATGRRARFATAQGARKVVTDRLVGIGGVFEGVDRRDGVLVEACRDGWWYSAPLPGRRAIVAFLGDADVARAAQLRAYGPWCTALLSRPHTMARLAGAVWPVRLHVHSARTQRLDTIAGTDWLAAGDAAATVDPLSSQGILKALRGGIFASYAIGDHLAGDDTAFQRYAAFVAAEHDDDLAARATHYLRENRWPDAPFWSRRHAAAPVPT